MASVSCLPGRTGLRVSDRSVGSFPQTHTGKSGGHVQPFACAATNRFTIDEGVVTIVFPAVMTLDSVDELEQFLNLFIKRARRRAAAHADRAPD